MLSLVDAHKRFGAIEALAGCSLTIERGHVLGFLGPNGAGKTTTMRAIFGLVELDAGEVLWDGRSVGPEERLRFGYMPEERGLYPRMSGRGAARVLRLSARAGRGRVAPRATSHGSSGSASPTAREAKVEELSHGNQQRVQLAAALVHEPELLVLDEPFAGLDPVAVHTLADVLRAEAARGAAVLFSSHQLELVEDVCENVAIIDQGRIVAAGDLDALRRSSQRRRIAVRLDEAPPDWLPGVDGVELVERRNGDVRLLARQDVDPELVLEAAERSARVVEFSYGPPSLAELFLELVER